MSRPLSSSLDNGSWQYVNSSQYHTRFNCYSFGKKDELLFNMLHKLEDFKIA
jgi:hypothetical protein